MNKQIPVLNLRRCTDCDSCLELCPEVFQRNPETGLIEVRDLAAYPVERVEEAMSVCPEACIDWET